VLCVHQPEGTADMLQVDRDARAWLMCTCVSTCGLMYLLESSHSSRDGIHHLQDRLKCVWGCVDWITHLDLMLHVCVQRCDPVSRPDQTTSSDKNDSDVGVWRHEDASGGKDCGEWISALVYRFQ
jgi:hypothetical protein